MEEGGVGRSVHSRIKPCRPLTGTADPQSHTETHKLNGWSVVQELPIQPGSSTCRYVSLHAVEPISLLKGKAVARGDKTAGAQGCTG